LSYDTQGLLVRGIIVDDVDDLIRPCFDHMMQIPAIRRFRDRDIAL
jgi:hypothetical protein